jgi:hypothetical protein
MKQSSKERLWERIDTVQLARGASMLVHPEFLKMRKIRNLLTHDASSETQTRLLTFKQAEDVFNYCLRATRVLYPYNITVRT